MKEHGYVYGSPAEAIGEQMSQASESPTPEEIQVASADIDCKIETNLVGIGVELQRQLDEAYIAEHREELAQFRADIERELRDGA